MPKIKAFKGILPDPKLAERLVVDLENFTLSDAKEIRDENPQSFVHMLVPKIENRYLRGSKQELAYKFINENFEHFLDEQILVQDKSASIYVYQVNHYGFTQTGIWTLTSIDDYLANKVKKHELTRPERERKLIEYLEHTGIDTNPVLITYHPVPEINKIIKETVTNLPLLKFRRNEQEHIIWRIDGQRKLQLLIQQFKKLSSSYIADGHHRAAAASMYGIQRRKQNFKHRGDEEYNFFASVYMTTEQVKIFEFNRLIKDFAGLTEGDFLEKLECSFHIFRSTDKPVKPESLHTFGMYLKGGWFELKLKPELKIADHPVSRLDVSILQKFVLDPLLKIKDPRTDERLSFSGGITPLEELMKQVNAGNFAVAFTLYPTTVEQLIAVADKGEVMPPKSTWFEPKFLTGLLIHKVY